MDWWEIVGREDLRPTEDERRKEEEQESLIRLYENHPYNDTQHEPGEVHLGRSPWRLQKRMLKKEAIGTRLLLLMFWGWSPFLASLASEVVVAVVSMVIFALLVEGVILFIGNSVPDVMFLWLVGVVMWVLTLLLNLPYMYLKYRTYYLVFEPLNIWQKYKGKSKIRKQAL